MDSIDIANIRCYGYTGLLPEEKKLGQWFSVDLIISFDLEPVGHSDELSKTVDYRLAIAAVKKLIKEEGFDLIESLAEAIANKILEFERVQQVRVRLTKEAAPIPDFDGSITIDITRYNPVV